MSKNEGRPDRDLKYTPSERNAELYLTTKLINISRLNMKLERVVRLKSGDYYSLSEVLTKKENILNQCCDALIEGLIKITGRIYRGIHLDKELDVINYVSSLKNGMQPYGHLPFKSL